MDNKTTILIADDHSLVRKGLRQVLESEPSFIVIEAENGEETLQKIREFKPSVAVIDVEMPKLSGFDVAFTVKQESLPVSVVFLTMFREESVFNKAMDNGVKGYVLKDNTITEILQCIDSVLNGNYYLSPSISEFLMKRSARENSGAKTATGVNLLTITERKLLKNLAEMKTNQEIADILNISIKTVHNHRTNICDKLGLHGAHALLKFAVENSSEF